MTHARALAAAPLTGLLVALALVGAGAASHSTLTATLWPKTIEQGIWRNITVTVRNEGPEPVNVSNARVTVSWSPLGKMVFSTTDPRTPSQSVIRGTIGSGTSM